MWALALALMWHVAGAAARRWVGSAMTLLAFVGSLATAWHVYERYLHHLHGYEQELRHARFVLQSNACAVSANPSDNSAHFSSRTKRYVDCDGALEALNGPLPASRAMGSVLDEWTICGEGRCAQLGEWALDTLRTVRGAAPVVAALILWMLAHRLWFGHRQSQARSGGLAPLDAGAHAYAGHHCLWAPGSEWELSAGGDHMMAMAGPQVAATLHRRRVNSDMHAVSEIKDCTAESDHAL